MIKGKKRAMGLDSGLRVLVLVTAVMIFCLAGTKWYSVPELKYTRQGMTFYPREFSSVFRSLLSGSGNLKRTGKEAPGHKHEIQGNLENTADLLSAADLLNLITHITEVLNIICIILSFCLIICILFFRTKSRKNISVLSKITFSSDVLLGLFIQAGCVFMNILLFRASGRKFTILNLALKSRVQLTAVPYTITAAGLISLPFTGKIQEKGDEASFYRSEHDGIYEKARLKTASFLILIIIPFTVFFGIFFLNDRNYYFISIVIAVLSMMPFFMVFENKRPMARELVITAVMTAICIAGRAAFFMVPFFKPIFALVIINGAVMGAESGFLTGALAAFGSNFIFGQGPWTPWQMFCMGIIGFLSGVIFSRIYRINTPEIQKSRKKRILSVTLLCLYAAFCTIFIYGFIMDTATVFMYSDTYNLKLFKAAYISGFPVNLMHAGSTIIFIILLWKPLSKKLNRIKVKYGILSDAVKC